MTPLNNTIDKKYFNPLTLIFGYRDLYLHLHLHLHRRIRLRPQPYPHLRLHLLSESGEETWELTNPQSFYLVKSITNYIDLHETIREF